MSHAALQEAVFHRLSTYAPLTALVAGVHDHVPQDAAFPYCVIGEESATQWDTDTELGFDATFNVHTWSRYRGRLQAKQIMDRVYQALHRYELPVADAHVVTVEFDFADTLLDPDGLTRHGVQRFRVLFNQEV